MDRSQRTGVLLMLLSITGYAFFPVFTKTLYEENIAPSDLALWRFAIAAPILWALSLLRARRVPLTMAPLPRGRVLVLGAIMGVAALVAFFGLQYLPAATYVVLFYTHPAMIALIGLALGERLPLIGWVALGMTLTGVILTAPDFTAGFMGDSALGVLLALLNAFVVALYYVVSQRTLRGYPDMARATAWSLLGALILIMSVSLVNGFAAPPTARAWALLIGLALVCTIMPIFTLNAAIQKLGATRASIIGTIEPILAATLALILLNEQLQAPQIIGGAVIILSVLLLELRSMFSARNPAQLGVGD